MINFLAKAVSAFFFVLATTTFSNYTFAQGDTGFLRGKGHGDVVLTYGQERFDRFYAGSSSVSNPNIAKVRRGFYSLYAAYGITDEIDLGANATFLDVNSSGVIDDESGIQDLALYLKARLLKFDFDFGQFNVLAKPGIKLPLANYENNTPASLGDGQIDLQARVVAQIRSHSGYYFATEAGFDKRNGSPRNQLMFSSTIGGPIVEDLYVSAFYSNVNTLGGGDIGDGTSFPAQEKDYSRVGANLFFRLTDQLGLSLTGWRTVTGKNTAKLSGLALGAVWSW